MSFIDFIEKLQNKPKYIRIQVLVVCVALCMAAVIFFWLVSFDKSVSVITKEPVEPEKETPSLTQILKASISAFFEKEETDDKEIEVQREEIETTIEEEFLPQPEKIKPAKLPIIP